MSILYKNTEKFAFFCLTSLAASNLVAEPNPFMMPSEFNKDKTSSVGQNTSAVDGGRGVSDELKNSSENGEQVNKCVLLKDLAVTAVKDHTVILRQSDSRTLMLHEGDIFRNNGNGYRVLITNQTVTLVCMTNKGVAFQGDVGSFSATGKSENK